MERWLKLAGAVGLDDLDLANFPIVGRGIRALRHFKEGEKILTIPHSVLWTVKHAYADSLLGPAIRSVQPSLSVDDTLVIYSICPLAGIGLRWPAKPCDGATHELFFEHLLYGRRAESLCGNFTVRYHEASGTTNRGRLQGTSHAIAWTVSRPFPTRQIHHRRCGYYAR